MIFGVAPEKMGNFVASIADPVGAALGASRRLPLFRAVKATPAGSRGVPCHSVADLQRLAAPVAFHAAAEMFDSADSLMPEDHRQSDGKLALPEMHVRAANPG